MSQTPSQLTYKKILRFWLPLAATWVMMSVEGPYLAALIARSAEPKFNLAAYGIAYSLVLIVEAPIIMIMSAAIALVRDSQSFKMLKNFTYSANIIITLILIILVIPPVFYFITEDLIGLPAKVSELTHVATIILIPWPGAIGYRRFYQGLLIKNDMTRKVAYGTVIRLFTMSLCAFLLFASGIVEGVIIGAISLSSGVILEAVAVRLMVKNVIKKIFETDTKGEATISYKEIYRFYYPLALTSLIGLGVQPLVTFFVGKSAMAIESLAILPVVTSFVFIFRALGLSYQEVIISLMGQKNEGFHQLKNFGLILAVLLVTIVALFAFTPLSEFWFITVSGLSVSLAEFSKLPLIIMFFFPALTVIISIQRGLLVSSKNTNPITVGTIIEFSTIVLLLFILINFFDVVGAVAATVSFVLGRISANIYLTPSSIRSSNRSGVTEKN